MAFSRVRKVLALVFLLTLVSAAFITAQAAIAFLRSDFTIGVKQTASLPVKNAEPVKWETSKSKIFTVDENGLLTGVKAGTAKIRVTGEDGTTAVTKIRVVAKNKGVRAFKLNCTAKTLGKGRYFTLKTAFVPSSPTDKTVKWLTSNSSVASVSKSGKVTGKGFGTATITAVSSSGLTASCEVEVVPVEVTGIKLSRKTASLKVGKSGTLKATISPSDASDKTVVWESSDPEIATVTNGKVVGKSTGTVTIKATTANGKVALCSVKVTPVAVTKVTLNKTSGKMAMGKTYQLKATVAPSNATDKTITWKSSNPGIVTVSETGLLTGVAPGTATVTALSSNGKTKATCKVTITGSTSMVQARDLLNSIALKPTPSGYAPLDKKINNLFAELFTEGMTTYDKVVAVFDYMVISNTYLRTHGLPGITGYSNEHQAKALYILTYHQGSCTDYSSAFMYMMRAIGIPCTIQYGQTSALAGGWTGHYWNNVIINGVEYIFDCQVEKNAMSGGKITYTRFCKTYPEMTKKYKKG